MVTSSSHPIVIEEMYVGDMPASAEIVRSNWGDEDAASARIDFERGFGVEMERPKYLVAKLDGKVVGCVGFIQSWMQFGWYEIFWVNVDANLHRQGIGTALMVAALQTIQEQNPDAVMATLSSEHPDYYVPFGFQIDRHIPPKGNNTKNDYLMSRLF